MIFSENRSAVLRDQSLHHDRLVRQLIGVAAILRKMRRELSRHRRDPIDHAGFEISRTEVPLHRGADLLPTLRPDLGGDAAIGDDLDLAVGEQEIDQHAVVVMGVPDAQMREDIQRALARRLIAKQWRAVERAFNDKPHLAGVSGLAGLDGLLDRRQHARRKDPPHSPAVFEKVFADALDIHRYQLSLPASRRAAATKAAAAPGEAATRARAAAPSAAISG